ncbi:Rap1a/Tai family immunity protein [Nitrosomonas mobilis]|uniref:Rap1a/Tai family immunity protein n=1 Tax=Nitrosomonas mobilis TaxID=51642 RepID=UPI0015A47EEA
MQQVTTLIYCLKIGGLFCTTSGVTRGQFIAIVAKYLKNNPEKWNMSADSIVFYAMKEAFPCKK